MSFAQDALIDALARLRLACRALSSKHGGPVTPDDIRLDDVDPAIATELRREAGADLWRLLNQAEPPKKPATKPAPKRPALSRSEA